MPNPLLPEAYERAGRELGGARPRQRKASRPWSRPRLVAVGFLPGLLALYVVWSVAGAATTLGNQGFAAKWADWLRHHHAAFAVTDAERFYYSLEAPAKGGRSRRLNALPGSSRARTSTARDPAGGHLPAPSRIPLVVRPALPKEGVWQPVGPGMYEAQFRADTVYTSEITSAVWIDPKVLRLALVPGQTDPGGTWAVPPYITEAERPRIEAAFNGGFLESDAHGGFYLDGRTAAPLVRGAASLVLYRDGTVDIGAWGTEVHMSSQVTAVLQNLVPLVDHGRVSPSATYNDSRVWGATLGATPVVARSGVGVTRDGALVYVAGPALTARTLAESLQRAGAVRAMTLDMNPEWVTFNFFGHPDPKHPATLAPSSLYPQMQRPATRYLGPTREARDFFTVSLPPGSRP